jgi:hypothetical protein
MGDDRQTPRSEADAELEREIRKERKFSLAEAIGRMAGPGGMKGASPVAGGQEAGAEIEHWLNCHLTDNGGGLRTILLRSVKASPILLSHYDQPLVALRTCCQKILGSDYLLQEFVRNADIEWGRLFGERPHFEREGLPAHPDDPYTIDSVRRTLTQILQQLDSDLSA